MEAVRKLCSQDEVNPNIPAAECSFDGNYPLHEAMTRVGPEELLIIRALADKGAFMECENQKKQTAFLLGFKRLLQDHAIAHSRLIALLALGAKKKPLIYAHDNIPLESDIKNIIHRFSVTTASGKQESQTDCPSLLDRCFRMAVTGTLPGDDLFTRLRYTQLRHIGAMGINLKDAIYGMTPLMWAAALGNLGLAKVLLAHPQIDFTITDNFGDTALHYAARNGHAEIVKLLLAYPQVLSIVQNNSGATAYDLAKMRDHKAVGRLLGHERIIQARIMRYFTTRAKNNADAPSGWPFLPEEIALRILTHRAQIIGTDGDRMRKIIELCGKGN